MAEGNRPESKFLEGEIACWRALKHHHYNMSKPKPITVVHNFGAWDQLEE